MKFDSYRINGPVLAFWAFNGVKYDSVVGRNSGLIDTDPIDFFTQKGHLFTANMYYYLDYRDNKLKYAAELFRIQFPT